ncbi:MAG: zf-HC2 domain-containing protein [Anaerolineaceae bacterium]
MDEHVKTLLSAYMDGELESHAETLVRKHLTTCEECQNELAGLKNLSGLLRATPAVERLSSSSQFAARVNLMLPDRQPEIGAKTPLQIGLWFIPLGLLSAWIIIQIASIMTLFILTAESAGYLGQLGNLLPGFGQSANQTVPFAALFSGLFDKNILSILNVGWSAWQTVGTYIEGFAFSSILALMYLAWLVVVWQSNSGMIKKSATATR